MNRPSSNSLVIAALAAYVAMAIVTFGYAHTHQPPLRYVFILGKCFPTTEGDRLFSGAFAAAAWPFYLSVVAWEAAGPEPVPLSCPQ